MGNPLITNSPINDWQYTSPTAVTDTNADEVVAAVAGRRHRVTGVHAVCTGTTGTVVQVRSGTTVLWQGFAGAYVAATPGTSVDGDQFIRPLKGDAGADINVINVTNASSVFYSLQGYTETA